MSDKLKQLLAGARVDPRFLAFLAAIRVMCLIGAAVLADQHLGQTKLYQIVEGVGGSVVALGTGAYGVYATLMNLLKVRAISVQAGISMTAGGKAVDCEGNVIDKFEAGSDATPPKLVTYQTSAEIVKEFAPPAAAIKKE